MSWKHILLALLIGLVIYGARSFDSDLRKDSAVYAAISKEVNTAGHPLRLTLDGVPYWNKPPLFFWANAVVIRGLGPTVFSAKLVSILGGAVNLALVWLLARRLTRDDDAALFAALLAGLTYGVLRTSNACRMENMVIGLALLSLLCVLRYADSQRLRWMLGFGACVGLGILAKGWSALLPLVAGWLFLLRRPHGVPGAIRLRDAFLSLVAAALVCGWWYAYAFTQPGFADIFFRQQAFDRVAMEGDFWYAYVPMWLKSCVLWLPWLVLGLRRWWRDHRGDDTAVLLLIYAALVLVSIHGLSTKYDRYLLPVYYATAIFAALGIPLRWRPAAPRVVVGFCLFVSTAVSILPLPFLHVHDFSRLSRVQEIADSSSLPLVVDEDVLAHWETGGAALYFLDNVHTAPPTQGAWLEVRKGPDGSGAPVLLQTSEICLQLMLDPE